MLQRQYPHNTPEQVEEYLTAALDLVERLDPPGDLRVAAFTKAADLFASKQIMYEQANTAGGQLIPRFHG